MSEQTTLPEQPEQAAHEGLVDRVKRDRRLQLEVAGGIGLLVLGFVFGNLGDLTSPSASDTAIVQPRNQVLFDLTWDSSPRPPGITSAPRAARRVSRSSGPSWRTLPSTISRLAKPPSSSAPSADAGPLGAQAHWLRGELEAGVDGAV